MGLLDGILGGQQNFGGPLGGGLGGGLGGLLGGLGGGLTQRHGISPLALAVIGTLAYRNLKNKGGLGAMFGGPQQQQQAAQPPATAQPNAPGGLFSGAVLSEGLNELLAHFRQNGQAEKAESWVSGGPNQQISPAELEQALGSERIEWLSRETGLGKQDLLDHLAQSLPHAVDKLTPDGHVPSASEAQRLM